MKIADNIPIRLTSARAWRTYLGGKYLDRMQGKSECIDSHFPEEWIISVVSARNAGREHIKNEGLSMIQGYDELSLKDIIDEYPSNYLGENHYTKYNNQTGVLVKLIDSAERLTVQVHPDRIKSKELFDSSYGKTECWHILGGREIEGKKPSVYLGFKEGISREYWKSLFDKQDLQGMLDCMHEFEVQQGDTILIEGGIPHAIGAGCFLVEIQEPTDYTIRVEKTTPSGLNVDDLMCHQGLGFDKMFECFHYEGLSREQTYDKWFIKQSSIYQQESGRIISLIGYDDIEYFKMNMLEVTNKLDVNSGNVFSGLFLLEGNGTIVANNVEQQIKAGEQFFIPANTNEFVLNNTGEGKMKAIHCYGPKT